MGTEFCVVTIVGPTRDEDFDANDPSVRKLVEARGARIFSWSQLQGGHVGWSAVSGPHLPA
jgi:hypothetical protein